MFKTITSRFTGECRRCKKAGLSAEDSKIEAGQKVRWARGAGAYHLTNQCPASQVKSLVGAGINEDEGGDSSQYA